MCLFLRMFPILCIYYPFSLPLIPQLLWMMPALCALTLANYYTSDTTPGPGLEVEAAFLHIYAVTGALYTMYVVNQVVHEMLDVLNIYLFSLQKRPPKATAIVTGDHAGSTSSSVTGNRRSSRKTA